MKKFFYLNTENRIFGLDILRFIAIMFVMITHAGRFFPEAYIKYYTSVIYDGVGIFFVLSGFLIGGILLKQMGKAPFNFKELKEFWYKRWSRTLPNYYLYLIILLLIPFYSPVLEKIIPNFFFLQNMMTKPENNFFGWSWSLSVEEWFYLIIPIIIYIFINYFKVDYKRSFLVTVALIITAGIVLRMQNYWGGEFDFSNIRYSVLYRIDAIMYGLLGAYLQKYCNTFWNKNKRNGVILGLLGLFLYYFTNIESNGFYRGVFSFSVTSFTVLCFLPFLTTIKSGATFGYKFITYISLISYSMYLSNSLISDVLVYSFDWDYWVKNTPLSWGVAKGICFILFWILTITVSFINYKYFELPVTHYLRKKMEK